MRKRVSQRLSGRLLARSLMTVAVASLLAACSNSVERFQNAYTNPSDADPVYTASVPKSVQKPVYRKRPVIVAPDSDLANDDVIVESPVARAPLSKSPDSSSYDYTENSEKTYKQQKLVAPKPRFNAPKAYAFDESDSETPVALEPPLRKSRKQMAEADLETDLDSPIAKPKSGKSAITHTVKGGETLFSLGRKYGVSPFVIADANGFSHDRGLHIGQKVKIPGTNSSTSKAVASADVEDAPVKKSTKKKAPLSLADEESAAKDETQITDEPVQTAKTKDTSRIKPEAKVEQQVAQLPNAGALNLRWPLKGKVISNYGPKSNGLKNEGINIAVPEGTSIRAADGGVVAYAGNELKGYGNLVLIRHTGGYVTAYAHAKELLVKRGDTVKRGDVIAKAGQTGAVSSPQLHFEVRKGATALDPMKHLASATAMN